MRSNTTEGWSQPTPNDKISFPSPYARVRTECEQTPQKIENSHRCQATLTLMAGYSHALRTVDNAVLCHCFHATIAHRVETSRNKLGIAIPLLADGAEKRIARYRPSRRWQVTVLPQEHVKNFTPEGRTRPPLLNGTRKTSRGLKDKIKPSDVSSVTNQTFYLMTPASFDPLDRSNF